MIGGTSGIGRELAAAYVARGARVTLSGRDAARAQTAAAGLGDGARGIAFDLAEPHTIAGALRDIEKVDRLALVAVDRDENTVAAYEVDRAIRLATLKLVGYTEVVHALSGRLTEAASIVLFGGQALRRPYPGSTTVTRMFECSASCRSASENPTTPHFVML